MASRVEEHSKARYRLPQGAEGEAHPREVLRRERNRDHRLATLFTVPAAHVVSVARLIPPS
jgi:hypothetical protein